MSLRKPGGYLWRMCLLGLVLGWALGAVYGAAGIWLLPSVPNALVEVFSGTFAYAGTPRGQSSSLLDIVGGLGGIVGSIQGGLIGAGAGLIYGFVDGLLLNKLAHAHESRNQGRDRFTRSASLLCATPGFAFSLLAGGYLVFEYALSGFSGKGPAPPRFGQALELALMYVVPALIAGCASGIAAALVAVRLTREPVAPGERDARSDQADSSPTRHRSSAAPGRVVTGTAGLLWGCLWRGASYNSVLCAAVGMAYVVVLVATFVMLTLLGVLPSGLGGPDRLMLWSVLFLSYGTFVAVVFGALVGFGAGLVNGFFLFALIKIFHYSTTRRGREAGPRPATSSPHVRYRKFALASGACAATSVVIVLLVIFYSWSTDPIFHWRIRNPINRYGLSPLQAVFAVAIPALLVVSALLRTGVKVENWWVREPATAKRDGEDVSHGAST